jgi:nucleotide-binding universal stress UspA family protein
MHILVGTDGSGHGLAAARWAAREARMLGVPLTIVHVYSVPAVPSVAGPVRSPEQRRYARHRAEGVLDRTRRVADVELVGSTIRVSEELAEGPVSRTLIDLSHGAGLLVLGSHSGQFLHHRLGSMVGACLHKAGCPVVVVPVDVPSFRRHGA